MFNGEYSCFLKIKQIERTLDNLMIIGAARDYFYLDMMCEKQCLLVEPSLNSANDLSAYIRKQAMPHKAVANVGMHPVLQEVEIYTGSSIYKRKEISETKQAIDSGLIFCPTTSQLIKSEKYLASQVIGKAQCISPNALLDLVKFFPDYIKIDIEGAEFLVIKEILKTHLPNFIQYEFGVPWFHADVTHDQIVDALPSYYHYIIGPKEMKLIDTPLTQYFYANIIASRFYLGKSLCY